jgi:membrane-anchored glycerophosphoryl diester phosphodiesterase (GDPDase)
MQIVFWITVGILFALPDVIAYKRKCKDRLKIAKLGYFLGWTVFGWVVAMVWAICGESDPEGFTKLGRKDYFLDHHG